LAFQLSTKSQKSAAKEDMSDRHPDTEGGTTNTGLGLKAESIIASICKMRFGSMGQASL
jgi:hypothetical protein